MEQMMERLIDEMRTQIGSLASQMGSNNEVKAMQGKIDAI
jgi:hypothetical protein